MAITQLDRSAVLFVGNFVNKTSIEIDGLRITFNLKKSSKSDGNTSTIKVYNLSESSRAHCQTESTKNKQFQTHIELKVGYGINTKKSLFKGLAQVTSTWQAPDWVTTFQVTDGVAQTKTAKFEKEYKAGHPVTLVIDDMLKSANLGIQINQTILGTLKRDRTFTGPVLKNIEDLSATFGFTFDIQDEETVVKVIPQIPPPLSGFIVLGASSGLLGKPQLKGDQLMISCLINTDLRPNSYVSLDTSVPKLSGGYLIKGVTVTGDTWGGPWTMILEVQSPFKVPVISIKEGS